jgi:predicted transport protein
MEGLISGKKRTYDEFRSSMPSNVATLFDEIRNYCLALGQNVVEDIRMHRIVFAKSIKFRSFADVEPQRDSVIIKIKKDRKEPEKELQIKLNDNLDEIKKLLVDAYTSIH